LDGEEKQSMDQRNHTEIVTSRDLVLQAIAHESPVRIPATLYIDADLKSRLLRERGYDVDRQFVNDTVRVLWEVESKRIDADYFTDPFGCTWRDHDGGYMFVNPPMSEPNVADVPRIALFPACEKQRVLDARAANPDAFIYYQFTMTFGERLWALRGMENYLMDLASEPKFIHGALDVLLEMHMEALEELFTLPIDGVTFGDDFGSQKGLMISPASFREFYKPRLAKLYGRVRDAGVIVGAHSCGDNTLILGDYIDIGLQIFHPLQPECMDIAAVKREFGKHLTFRGGIGTQGAAAHGTPEDARRAVIQATRILSENGGYLLEPCKPLPGETPLDTAIAFIQALQDVRNYCFEG
jgi:uroporphyrinogen decarboxylase